MKRIQPGVENAAAVGRAGFFKFQFRGVFTTFRVGESGAPAAQTVDAAPQIIRFWKLILFKR